MPQFELSNANVKLAHVNLRPELHGEETVPACDLKIEAKLPNDELALFHPTLKSLLYCYDETRADLADQASPENAVHLRFPKLGPLKYDTELVGAAVVIAYGVQGHDIELEGCKVNEFKLEPLEGGTVTVTFRIQASSIKEAQIAKLATLIQTEVELTVTPPEDGQAELKAAA